MFFSVFKGFSHFVKPVKEKLQAQKQCFYRPRSDWKQARFRSSSGATSPATAVSGPTPWTSQTRRPCPRSRTCTSPSWLTASLKMTLLSDSRPTEMWSESERLALTDFTSTCFWFPSELAVYSCMEKGFWALDIPPTLDVPVLFNVTKGPFVFRIFIIL